jgi:hypothetical protein
MVVTHLVGTSSECPTFSFSADMLGGGVRSGLKEVYKKIKGGAVQSISN